ncbi:MAG: mycothiol biosynthesis acetyltransferase [Frankiales bacterium]|nr:mycothiol biosynthesis acetyltransferase [Frankiales bacterium]
MTVLRQTGLSPEQRATVLDIARAATATDGHPPLSEQVLLHLADPGAEHLLVGTDGYAHLAGGSAELVVRPRARRHGIGRQLAEALVASVPALAVWAHGEHPGATRLGEQLGLRRARVLFQMRRPLSAPLPDVRIPAGVAFRTFEVGRDEAAWTALNAAAFAHHPEQGGWSTDDLRIREGEPWFDAAGFFLAERAGRLVGFHWTKTHPATEAAATVGEVYVVGVDPAEQGSGLGSALTLLGLHHLRERGLAEVLLYVDEDNPAAVHVYERLGFTVASTDVQWVRP